MARKLKELNQAQADLLRWVQNGCPAGVYDDGYEHRVMARALERRGLVTIKGSGDSWQAAMTRAGRDWLADPPKLDNSARPSEADALVSEVLAAGGVVEKPGLDHKGREALEKLISASLRSTLRPHGERLVLGHKGHWPNQVAVVQIEPYFEERVEASPVPVPERVSKYHPAARAFLDDVDTQYVTKASVSRAARLLHAISVEAGRRGIQLQASSSAGQRRYERRKSHLILTPGADSYTITIKEIPGRGGDKIDYSERYRSTRVVPDWQLSRTTRFISTGTLELIVDGRYAPYGGKHIRDTTKIKLEDRLSELFAALDKYELESIWKEEQRQEEARERERLRQLAIERATVRYYQQARWEHFTELVRLQDEIVKQRAFIAEARRALDDLEATERQAVEQHLDSMGRRVDAHDPLATPSLLLPEIPSPTDKDLEPFLTPRSNAGLGY